MLRVRMGTPSPPPGRRLHPRPVAAVVGGLAVALWVLYGDAQPGYDATYSLVWGRELAHAHLPHFDVEAAPTPHPLAYLTAAFLTPLGTDAAPDAMAALGYLSFALLGWAAFRLGASLFSDLTGFLFAAMVLALPQLVSLSLLAGHDLPFLALLLLACAAAVDWPGRPARVLALLGLAGLLRPEAWLLSAAYLAALVVRGRRPGPRLMVLAAAAPVVWLSLDLAATGDPLHSLHATQDLAELVERPRGLGSILSLGPSYLSDQLGRPMLALGLVGFTASCILFAERWVLPGTLVVLALVAFTALGVTGLPVLPRYLLTASVLLVLFGAVSITGWAVLDRTSRLRRPWLVVAVALAGVALLSVPPYRERIDELRTRSALERAAQADLERLVTAAPARRTMASCPPLSVENFRLAPLLAYWLDRAPGSVRLAASGEPRAGTEVVLRPSAVLERSPLDDGSPLAPRRSRPRHASRYWLVYASCRRAAS